MNGWIEEFPRQELVFHGQGAGFRLLLKRNCSISPAGLTKAYGLIALVTMGIAGVLASLGAWPVLPFAGLEIALLGIAFVMNGRHAADYERIELEGSRLVVEVCESDSVRRHETTPVLTRVRVSEEGRATRILLEMPDGRVEIGRHLHAQARRELAGELDKRLRN